MNENSNVDSIENAPDESNHAEGEQVPCNPNLRANSADSDAPTDAPRRKAGAPKGNANNFRHGLAALEAARQKGLPNPRGKKRFRVEFYQSLIEQAGGNETISPARRYQAEILSHDCAWLNKMVEARDSILRKKPEYLSNIAVLSKLDNYIRPVINSISANLDRFGYDRTAPRAKTLEELFAEDSNEPQSGTTTTAQRDGANGESSETDPD